MRIVYMGSPDFAVGPLDELLNNHFNVVAVVTVPDKPAGRGKKLTLSPVKKFALKHQIPVLQPENLKNEEFLNQLGFYNPDLQVIVAFRILPEKVWGKPPLGSINLHASLLPQYRGAAPIHWAIINGETETGVTTFFLSSQVDTGKILFQESLPIGDDETAGELHDRLMKAGSALLLKTVKAIDNNDFISTDQHLLFDTERLLKPAPKIFKEDCRINWSISSIRIRNKIRGLCPIPGAFTEIRSPQGIIFSVKIFRVSIGPGRPKGLPGQIITDNKTFAGITTTDCILHLEEVQLASKSRMGIREFLKGFKLDDNWTVL
jgi:methionyl-tRNA formyltransferase